MKLHILFLKNHKTNRHAVQHKKVIYYMDGIFCTAIEDLGVIFHMKGN